MFWYDHIDTFIKKIIEKIIKPEKLFLWPEILSMCFNPPRGERPNVI